MDKETINDSENINSDEWKFLLLMMLTEDIKQKNSQWKSFEDELIYKNRFSVKHASKYLSTQYIAEEIKNMGFDGLRFRSSLNKNGYNIVLFNPDDCVAVSSDLVEVKGIDLKLDEPMIYKVGTPKLKEEMTNLDWMK